jgi:hypothetical protein
VYGAIDIALLQAEHAATSFLPTGSGARACPICLQLEDDPHSPGCEMDLALAERNFPTKAERDTARKRLITATVMAPTLPPPPSTETA